VNQRLLADTDLIEFVCGENERYVSGRNARRER